LAKQRKRSAMRKAREVVDKTMDSFIKNGIVPPERAGRYTYRIGGQRPEHVSLKPTRKPSS
jgi:hypothetical protein